MGLVTASVGLVTDRWGGSLVWWLISGRGGDWWSDLFVWVSNCRVGWLIGFVVVVGFKLAWDGFFYVWDFFVWIGCVVFLDYFGALGFDDFVGFEKMGILRFLIFGF